MRYEMEGMAAIRRLITANGFTHEDMDTFKRVLSWLEQTHQFELKGPAV